MLTKSIRRTILVPILDGDITERAFRTARTLVSRDDTHLVLVHVAPETEAPARRVNAAVEPRWRQLAAAAPGRTFIEAVAGDPTTVVRAEAERFGTDTIVVGQPSPTRKHPRAHTPRRAPNRITHHAEAEQAETGDSTSLSSVARETGIGVDAIDALFERLPVGVLVADRDGRIVYSNGEARARQVDRLDHIHWAITRALLTEDVVREDDIEVLAPGQPRRWLSILVTPLRTPGVGVRAAFVVVSDVTARKQMAGWTPQIESLVNL